MKRRRFLSWALAPLAARALLERPPELEREQLVETTGPLEPLPQLLEPVFLSSDHGFAHEGPEPLQLLEAPPDMREHLDALEREVFVVHRGPEVQRVAVSPEAAHIAAHLEAWNERQRRACAMYYATAGATAGQPQQWQPLQDYAALRNAETGEVISLREAYLRGIRWERPTGGRHG